MTNAATEVAHVIKEYILQEFLPGEDAEELTESTELLTSSIVDSVSSLRLVDFLEERFSIRIEAYEADAESLNTIRDMTALVLRKRGAPG